MNLTRFLENLIKEDGFVLIDANAKEYIIGKPKKINPSQWLETLNTLY